MELNTIGCKVVDNRNNSCRLCPTLELDLLPKQPLQPLDLIQKLSSIKHTNKSPFIKHKE